MRAILYLSIMIYSILNANEILVIQNGQQIKATNSGVLNMNDFNNSSCINSVWSYNHEISKWEVYSPIEGYTEQVTEDGTVDELFSIAPNEGFWVVTNDDASCEINVTTTNDSVITTIQAPTGWSLQGSQKQFDTLANFNKNTINIVWTYNTAQAKWGAYSSNPLTTQMIINKGDVDTISTINPQDGFWIHTTQATTIQLPNTAPTADAGADKTLRLSSAILLSASESFDIESNDLTYTWSLFSKPAGSLATLTNTTQENVIFIADVIGEYIFKLIVNDGDENSLEDTVVVNMIDSRFTFNTTEGWGSELYRYNGLTDSEVIITLGDGTYNIYAEIADGNSDVKAVIGTLLDENRTDITDSGLVHTGALETIPNSPANITIINDSGAERTYILPISAKLIENDNKVEDTINVSVINSTQNSYPLGGELILGDVDTNTLMMLGVDESHTWVFTAPSSGTYTLSISSDSALNKLMQFSIKLVQNANSKTLVNDNSEVGSFSQEKIILESGVSYLVKINTEVMQWDTIGKYTIKLIKD